MAPIESSDAACPFIDADDPHCGGRFSLSRIQQAFHVCLSGGYCTCPVYQRLKQEAQRRERSDSDTIRITIHGHELTCRHEPEPERRRAGHRSAYHATGS